MKKILVFGGRGFVGAELVRRLSECGYGVISASRAEHRTDLPRVECVTNGDLFARNVDLDGVEDAVVCAFSRESACDKLSAGLRFTEQVFRFLKGIGFQSVINISTQGVYAQTHTCDFIDETAEIGPSDCYGVAKYATELLAENIFGGFVNYTNIRLASVNMPQRFTNYFIDCARRGQSINVRSREQKFSLIDVSDVAEGLIALLDKDGVAWDSVYNLGAGYVDTIYHAAELVRDIVFERYGFSKVKVIAGEERAKLFSAVSNKKITNFTGWKPKMSLLDILKKTVFEKFGE